MNYNDLNVVYKYVRFATNSAVSIKVISIIMSENSVQKLYYMSFVSNEFNL